MFCSVVGKCIYFRFIFMSHENLELDRELRSGSMSGEKLDFSEFSKMVVAQNETQTVCGLVLFLFLITRKK